MSKHTEASMLMVPVSEQADHIQGPPNATITLVEYGDFECPHCGMAHPIVQEIQREFGDDLRFVYRHFPLTQIHPHAQRAAEAAEAAAQGKFWEMHDALFENQNALDDADLLDYAEELGLDTLTFRRDLLAGTYVPRVREDFLGGVRSGVNGTPTFFINGHRHDGPWDFDTLSLAIEEAMERHTPARRRGGRSGRGGV